MNFMKPKNDHKQIDLTTEQAEALRKQLLACNLNEGEKEILLGLISFNFWLRDQLSFARISIGRLKRLFGFRREKKSQKIPMM